MFVTMALANGVVIVMSSERRDVIIVTDAECASALACIRALGRVGFCVYGVGSDSLPPAAASRFLKRYYRTASPWQNATLFMRQIRELCALLKPTAVLPISEASVYWLSKVADERIFGCRLLIAGADLLKMGLSKIQTFEAAMKCNTAVADGIVLGSNEPFDTRSLEWPVIIRTDNRVDEDGRYRKGDSWIVHSSNEFDLIRAEQSGLGQQLLVQRYIPGTGKGCFVFLWNGKVILWHTHCRLAEIPWQGGISARRCLSFDVKLLEITSRLFRDVKCSGLAMVEFRAAEGTDRNSTLEQNFIVEVNARPWGSMALSLHADIPFAPMWAKHALFGVADREDAQLSRTFCDRAQILEHPVVCTSIYPGELSHLWSVFRSWLKNEIKFKFFLKHFLNSVCCVFHPQTKFDFYWKDDPIPALFSAINGIHALMIYIFNLAEKNFAQAIYFGFSLFKRFRKIAHGGKNGRKRILVVCYGNRCRSPFFELLLRKREASLNVEFFSRGLFVTDKTVPLRFHETFRQFNLEPEKHRAIQIQSEDVRLADEIIIMEYLHLIYLIRKFGVSCGLKCFIPRSYNGTHSEIEDPFLLKPVPARGVFLDLVLRAEQFEHLRKS